MQTGRMGARASRFSVLALAAFLQAGIPDASRAADWLVEPTGANPLTHLYGVWGTGWADIFIVGSGGAIFHYNGSAWSPMASATDRDLFGVWGSAANNVYAVGAAGTILHYDGSAWSAAASATTQNLRGVWGSAAGDIWAVGDAGTVLHGDGSSWSDMHVGLADNLQAVWGSGPGNVYAVDDNARILRYDGASWLLARGPTAASLWGIWGTAGNDIYAVGYTWQAPEGALILHYDGTGWVPMAAGSTAYLYGVWGGGAADVYAVGTDFAGGGPGPAILHFDGTAWSSMPSPADVSLYAVGGSGPYDVYACAYEGVTLYRGTARSAGTIQFASAGFVGNRLGEGAAIVVTRVGGAGEAASVDYTAGGGTAVAGADYLPASGTIMFAPGQTTQAFEVEILPGAAAGRTVDLSLVRPTGGATLGSPGTAVLTIVEGEPLPALSVAHASSDSGGLHFRVSLSQAVSWAVAFRYSTVDGSAVAGIDYVGSSETLVLLPGETSLVIDIPLIAGAADAADKTLGVALSDPIGATVATAQAQGAIINDAASSRTRCGAGAGAANLAGFYALCWAGLAAMKWRRPGRR